MRTVNSMSKTVTVMLNGRTITAEAGVLLSELTDGEKPCGGHGRCGKCKVVAKGNISEISEAEQRLLTEEEIASGVRLACLTRVLGDCDVQKPGLTHTAQIITDGVSADFECKPSFSAYGIAIDIGTTTLAAKLYDTTGKVLSEEARLNPQSVWGADVISRIEASLDGKAELLRASICGALDDIISVLADKAGVDAGLADSIVITGNTVMLTLLAGESAEPFSHAPFEAKRLFGETVSAEALGLCKASNTAKVYLAPCISAFVGADTVCAVIATDLCGKDTAMLADIGTNGEIALWNGRKLTVCSTAAGPAFEGVGISMGMRGEQGAIDKVSAYDGNFMVHVIGDAEPEGICGSGLVDAAACMLDLEILDESGYLEDCEVTIAGKVSLTDKDIRMLQLAKSAICAGILTLLDNDKCAKKDVSVLYIAGGFGSYLNKQSAARIGLLPAELAHASEAVGNAALKGAAMMLLNDGFRNKAEALAKKAETLELSTNKTFCELYISGMMF